MKRKARVSIFVFIIITMLLSVTVELFGSEPTDVSSDKNYIITLAPRVPLDAISSQAQLNPNTVSRTIRYFDGLGREIQTIGYKQSPTEKHIIQPVVYDDFGRVSIEHLPYVKSNQDGNYQENWSSEKNQFYRSLYNSSEASAAFSFTEFDNSPLNRAMTKLGPGASWHASDKKIEYQYTANSPNEVKKYHVENNGDLSLDSSVEHYTAGTLYKNTTIDEDGRFTTQWTDFQGRVIRTDQGRDTLVATTYYVYDDFGLLRWVLPPKISESEELPGTLSPADQIAKNLCYYYEYDARKRLVKKQIPGAAHVLYIYDNRDRLVLSQDGNQRAKDQKKFTIHKYDNFNRVIYSAEFVSVFPLSYHEYHIPLGHVDYVYDEVGEMDKFLENFWDKDTVGIYPETWVYDSNPAFANSYLNINYPSEPSINLKGLLAASRERAIGSDGELIDNWLVTRYFYDEKGRLIQKYSHTDVRESEMHIAFLLKWNDDLIEQYEKHIYKVESPGRGMPTEIVNLLLTTNTYDHASRLISSTIEFQENSDIIRNNVSFGYDELGRLTTDNLDGNRVTANYTYNIRDWLTNKVYLDINSNSYFNLTLGYENNVPNPQFAGNIATAAWSTINGKNDTYDFEYDGLNRLIFANSVDQRYSTSYSYDIQGNILNLLRNGFANIPSLGYNTVDDLDYTYFNNSNRLKWVHNNSEYKNEASFENYILDPDNPFGIGALYEYDANGNMKQDHRLSRKIEYNFLNLPANIHNTETNQMLHYTYTASGSKISQQLEDDGRLGTRREYAGPFVYVNNTLGWINTTYGRIVALPRGGFHKELHLRDHLGNTRIVLEEIDSKYEVVQEAAYYPFGMAIPSQSFALPNENDTYQNRYLYNGKEYQDDFGLNWYDYGARFYDAQIGRFHSVDPLTEKNHRNTPYSYAANNPINFIDWLGMDTVNVNTDQPIKQDDVVILDDGNTATASIDEVVINSSESTETENETIEFLPEIGFENDEVENPAGDIVKAGTTLALVVSQVDGPLPGPADAAAVALAGATFITAGVVYVGYEIYQFAHKKKKQSTGKARLDRHDKQYTHGGKKRPKNPNQRKKAEERRLKGKRTN